MSKNLKVVAKTLPVMKRIHTALNSTKANSLKLAGIIDYIIECRVDLCGTRFQCLNGLMELKKSIYEFCQTLEIVLEDTEPDLQENFVNNPEILDTIVGTVPVDDDAVTMATKKTSGFSVF